MNNFCPYMSVHPRGEIFAWVEGFVDDEGALKFKFTQAMTIMTDNYGRDDTDSYEVERIVKVAPGPRKVAAAYTGAFWWPDVFFDENFYLVFSHRIYV